MSDYINNLVARTFGLAPVVQPRLASLFEPVSVGAHNLSEAPLETETTSDALPSALPIAALTAPSILTTSFTQRWHENAERSKAETPRNSEDAHPRAPEPWKPGIFQNASQLPAAPQPPQRVSPTFSAELTGTEPPHAADKASRAPRAESVESGSRSKEHSDGDSWPRIEPRVRRLIDAHLTNSQTYPSTDGEQTERASTIQPPPPRSAQTATPIDIRPVSGSQQIANKLPAPAESPETISVTIGRVDVRAIFSQQPPTRPARLQTPAVNSLDEYLKQRSEGRR